MDKFVVFQQLPPLSIDEGEWEARLEPVGEVEAKDGAAAIAQARTWPVFKKARFRTLARHPIVMKIGAVKTESKEMEYATRE